MQIKHSKLKNLKREVIIFLMLLFVCFGASNVESATKLKFASWAFPGSPNVQSIKGFSKLLREESNGEILIEIMDGKAICPITKALDSMKSGINDGGLLPLTSFQSTFPKIMTLSFPFVFFNEEHVDKTIYGDIGRSLLEELSEASKLKGIAYLEDGFSNIGSRTKAIKFSVDLKGLQIGVVQELSMPSFIALKARPIPLPFSEIYVALERGVVSTGEVMPYSGYSGDADFKALGKVIKYLSLTKHSYRTSIIVFNSEAFNKLSKQYQDMILKTAIRISHQNKSMVREGVELWFSKWIGAGSTIGQPDRVTIRKSLERLFREPPKEIDKELLGTIKNACRWPPFCGSKEK